MHGRDEEIRHLARLVACGGVLVVRGGAGSGKSTLLDQAAALAGEAWLLRGAGGHVSPPFAVLHQLVAPVSGLADRLPATQAASLRAAVGLGYGEAEPLRVALGAVGVLAEAAAERPVVCLVDEAHLVDEASAEVLSFVAGRLPAGVALLVAIRGDGLAGLPELVLGGLEDAAAAALLDARHPGLSRDVRDRVIRETGGIPARWWPCPTR